MEIVIKPYRDLEAEERAYLEQYRALKREKKYEEAFVLLDYIEKNLYDIRRKFMPHLVINKERSIIYRKLKQPQLCLYYNTLSEVGGMLNCAFYHTDRDFVNRFYFSENFTFEGVNVNRAVQEYVQWFKPVFKRLNIALGVIERECRKNYLDYIYTNSRDLEIYLLSNSKDILEILKQIDDNPFENYYKKYVPV